MGREPPLGRHLRPRPQTSQRRRRPASDFGIRSVWSGGASISNENFASSRFQGVREITSREETERPPENRLGRSRQAPACPRNRKPAGDVARQIQPLPSRSGRLLDYESSGSPSPSQILPLTGNRKPAGDRTRWIEPAPCSSRRRSCPGRERGDRQSSVPADSTPSRARPPAELTPTCAMLVQTQVVPW